MPRPFVVRGLAIAIAAMSGAGCAYRAVAVPEPTVSAIQRSQALIRACRYEEAETFVSEQLATASGEERNLLLIAHGTVAEQRGDIETAVARYRAAASGESVPIDALRFLGLAQVRSRAFEEGYQSLMNYAAYRRRVERKRPWPTDMVAMAIAAAELARYDDAEAALRFVTDNLSAYDPLVLELRDQVAAARRAPPAPGAFWRTAYGDDSAMTGMSTNFDPAPLERRAPRYPKAAARERVEGHVLLELGIDEQGHVASATVRESAPPGVFDEAALAAVKAWKFRPASVHCRPVATRGMQRIDFKMAP